MGRKQGRIMAKSTKTTAQKTREAATQLELELVQYKLGNQAINFNIDIGHETVWASAKQIAELFERDADTVNHHIRGIYDDGELDEGATSAKFAVVQTEGGRSVTRQVVHYDLDVILGVGFRAKSPRASEFRKWAMSTLRSYIVDGYALNEARLKDDPNALRKLAAEIRKLRADEKNIYAVVREVFKQSSSDYDGGSKACRDFYALMQDKFHYAVTQNTAAELILGRASHKKPNMGVQSFDGNQITLDDVQIGKNYLERDELYILHVLCEQFLLYAESAAIRGKKLTMKDLSKKLDDLLSVNEYPVFAGYKSFLKDRAIKHAKAEYALYLKRLKSEDVRRIA
jgi:hypothetical protein